MSDSVLSVSKIDDRIAIVNENLREQIEQAAAYSGAADEELMSAYADQKGQAAVRERYFSGRKSSAIASCSGTSGKKLSRWQ